MSAKTGMAPTWSTEVAVDMNVIDGTITSSPGPMPSASSMAASATVPLANVTPWAASAGRRTHVRTPRSAGRS